MTGHDQPEYPPRILVDVGRHASVENGLSILPAIVGTIQADNGSLQGESRRFGNSHDQWQRLAHHRRLVAIAGCADDRRDHIAVAVAEGDYLVALHLLVSTEADVVTAFLGGCGRPIAMDNGDIQTIGLVKFQY